MIIAMTKRQQVDAVAAAAGITAKQARAALDAVAAVVQVALLEDAQVVIGGLGTFKVDRRAPRDVRNPATGKTMHVPSKPFVRFKPASDLRQRVEERHA